MQELILNALWLLVIGMIVVFFVLFLIVNLGSLLIRLVNKIPESRPAMPLRKSSSPLPPEHERLLKELVNKITQGKGSAQQIEKL
jgi:Na+-transporting methylmalonyl-CoA/oxaloacetate decarboxylase gamma subunit